MGSVKEHFYIKYRESIDFRGQWSQYWRAPINVGPWRYQLSQGITQEERKHYVAEFVKEYTRNNEWRISKGVKLIVDAIAVEYPPHTWILQHVETIEEEIAKQKENLEFYRREALMSRLSQDA